MVSPPELRWPEHGVDAWHACSGEHLNVSNVVLPSDLLLILLVVHVEIVELLCMSLVDCLSHIK